MTQEILKGLLLPFAGTALGASLVFFMKDKLTAVVQRGLNGFAAGVMMAASVWSLLIPAIERSEDMGRLSFLPAAAGLLVGIGGFLILDVVITKKHKRRNKIEAHDHEQSETSMMTLAIVLHNIPEGMAVGAVYAGIIQGDPSVSAAGALVLALGMAIQNFPEGAIISLPLKSRGKSRAKSFLYGILSGVAELGGAVVTIAASSLLVPAMPYLLGFAAGTMIYVVVDELIPEVSAKGIGKLGTIAFVLGFVVMMSLDVALG